VPEELSISEPLVIATVGDPADAAVKLTVAMGWLPDSVTLDAHAMLTDVAVCEF